MRSDIFDEYFRVAQTKGWVKEDINKTAQDSSASTRTERMTKDYKEKIQSLYGVIPEEDTLEKLYEKAHPEKVIIAPSYDKLNGLVENLKERQDIMIGVINRPMTGALTQHKYAQDLISDLVKTAFEAEAIGNDELAEQADECLQKVVAELEKKKINKRAFFFLPFLVALSGTGVVSATGVSGVAAALASTVGAWAGLGAALYLGKNLIIGHFSRGLKEDTNNLESNLTKALSYSSPENDAKINAMLKALNIFKEESVKIVNILSKIPDLSAENIKTNPTEAFAQKPNYSDEELKSLENYIKLCQSLEGYLNNYANYFRPLTPEQNNDWYSFFEGTLSTLTGQGGYSNLVSAIVTFNDSLKKLYTNLLSNIGQAAKDAKSAAVEFVKDNPSNSSLEVVKPDSKSNSLDSALPDLQEANDINHAKSSKLYNISQEIEDNIINIISKHRLGLPGAYSVSLKITSNESAIVTVYLHREPEDKEKFAREISEEIKPILSRNFKNLSSLKIKINTL